MVSQSCRIHRRARERERERKREIERLRERKRSRAGGLRLRLEGPGGLRLTKIKQKTDLKKKHLAIVAWEATVCAVVFHLLFFFFCKVIFFQIKSYTAP